MGNNSFFESHSAHARPMYIWMGQIVDEKYWSGNESDVIHTEDEIPGWGKRYKVRITGRDTQVKDVPDDQLEMAGVALPVTAGSGLGGSKQTVNLRQGDFVLGYFEDGIDGTQPIIMFSLPSNAQTELLKGDPEQGYIPRSGYYGLTGNKPVATKDLAPGSSPNEAGAVSANKSAQAAIDHAVKLSTPLTLPKPYICTGQEGSISKTQLELKKTIASIQKYRSEAGKYSDLLSSPSALADAAANYAETYVTTYLDRGRGWIIDKIQEELKPVYDELEPNKVTAKGKELDGLQEGLYCAFQKILNGLKGLIKGLLDSLFDQYINAPLCAISNFISSLLSSVLGQITGAIAAITSQIGAAVGPILDVVFQITDIVLGVLNLFICDSEVSCEMNTEWSIWDGPKKSTDGITSLTEDLKKRTAALQSENAALNIPPCNTAAIPCGPPTISFSGGGGSGASGNAIIGATGGILGIDVSSFGSSYTSAPSISINQACGSGSGAQLKPILGNPSLTQSGVLEASVSSVTPGVGSSTISGTFTGITEKKVNVSGTYVGSINSENLIVGTVKGTAQNGVPVQGSFTAQYRGTNNLRGIFIVTSTNNVGIATSGQPTGARSVVGAVPINPGVDYLIAPDGSVGGNESVFATESNTVVYDSKNKYTVYDPNETIQVVEGSTITLPAGSQVEIYNNQGEPKQMLVGKGHTVKIGITTAGSLTTPKRVTTSKKQKKYPTKDNGSYPVVLAIQSIEILNAGSNYSKNDEIMIEPAKGSVIRPRFGKNGQIIGATVVNSGIGFTDMPTISVKTKTGFNAVLQPVFKVIRVGDLPEGLDAIPAGVEVINVTV